LRVLRILLQYLFFIFLLLLVIPGKSVACKIFILKEEKDTVSLQSVVIEENRVTKFSGKDYITFVLPVSPGKSGSVVQLIHRQDETAILCDGETINVTINHPDGSTRDYPQVKIEDLRQYHIRVNIVGGNGLKKVYKIENYQTIKIDNGPIFDMLGSYIPLNPGEYSITTETEIMKSQIRLSGKIPLKYEHPLLFVEGKIEDGGSGTFIVDFGASGTLIGKEYLPDHAEIGEVTSIMYSENGTKIAPGTMGGVGGEVSGFLGNTNLKSLSFADIVYQDITVRVMENLPDLNQKKIAGIIGLDLLQQGEVVSLQYKTDSSIPVYMHYGSTAHPHTKSYNIPFTFAYGHMFVDGRINDIPVSFLFDTGARSIFISKSIAEKAKLSLNEKAIEIRGLDENRTKAFQTRTLNLRLAENQFKDVPLIVADLPVLESMGLLDSGGLLGNSFLENFQMVQIDFANNLIYLWE